LSLSELLRSINGARMLREPPLSGSAFCDQLAAPDPELRELLLRATVPEVLATGTPEQRARLAPLLLVTLPHLCDRPQQLWGALQSDLRSRPSASVATHVVRLCERLCALFSRRCWVERSGGSVEYAQPLTTAFPAACFVHLVREGWATALSMSKHPFFRVHVARLLTRDPTRPVAQCLSDQVPVDRFGAYWSALMHKTERTLCSLPSERQLVLDYEQLHSDGVCTLHRLARFLRIESGLERWVDDAASLARASEAGLDELEALDQARLLRACAPGMRVLDRLRRGAIPRARG
ncbi:MAG TPA: sulfotransferase, partial [Polyangiales bacterium]